MMRSFVDEKQNPLLWASTYHAGEYFDRVAVGEAKLKKKAKKLVSHSLSTGDVSDSSNSGKTSPKGGWEQRKESVVVEGVHLSLNFVSRYTSDVDKEDYENVVRLHVAITTATQNVRVLSLTNVRPRFPALLVYFVRPDKSDWNLTQRQRELIEEFSKEEHGEEECGSPWRETTTQKKNHCQITANKHHDGSMVMVMVKVVVLWGN
ncbi:hypothetical protein AgCh_018181 [Apium graveolens]